MAIGLGAEARRAADQIADGDETKSLISKVRIRYSPTVGLAVGDPRKRRQGGNTAVVLGRLFPRDEADVSLNAFNDLSRVVPGAVAQFSGSERAREFSDLFAPGTGLYFLLSAALILFFTYFYTSIIFNPVDIAENLKKQGGFIPGIKPGSKTAEYIDEVVSRITLPGAIFLTIMALLPVWIADAMSVPFRFGGTSVLIVVGVALDTIAQMNQHLLLRKYDGFMKKGRVRFRGSQASGGF